MLSFVLNRDAAFFARSDFSTEEIATKRHIQEGGCVSDAWKLTNMDRFVDNANQSSMRRQQKASLQRGCVDDSDIVGGKDGVM